MSSHQQTEESKNEVRQEAHLSPGGEHSQERLQPSEDGQALSNQKQGRTANRLENLGEDINSEDQLEIAGTKVTIKSNELQPNGVETKAQNNDSERAALNNHNPGTMNGQFEREASQMERMAQNSFVCHECGKAQSGSVSLARCSSLECYEMF